MLKVVLGRLLTLAGPGWKDPVAGKYGVSGAQEQGWRTAGHPSPMTASGGRVSEDPAGGVSFICLPEPRRD